MQAPLPDRFTPDLSDIPPPDPRSQQRPAAASKCHFFQLHRWLPVGWFVSFSNSQARPTRTGQRLLCGVTPTAMQFYASHSIAVHLAGGRGRHGGVPVTEGPKVSGFHGFGEENLKVWDTVAGETLTAPPGAIPSPPQNRLTHLPTDSGTDPIFNS